MNINPFPLSPVMLKFCIWYLRVSLEAVDYWRDLNVVALMCGAICSSLKCHWWAHCLFNWQFDSLIFDFCDWVSTEISHCWKLKPDIKSASQPASQDTVFTFKSSDLGFSFVNKGNPLHPLLWDFLFSFLSLICLQCTLFLSVVSLFLTRASLAPVELLQSDLSVKSDPFRLRSTDLLNDKVL